MPDRRTDWRGVFAVSATPFTPEGEVDEAAFGALMRTLVEDGVQGIVVAGSTGEWYTLRDDERLRLFELAREQVGGRTRLIAGTSAIATRDAAALTRTAKELGYDGAMVLAPPYALPSEREILGHFEAVAAVGLPLMVYNNPGRTQVNLTAPVIERLCALESVVALKDSSKDLYQLAQTLRAVGDRLAVFCGLEPYLLPMVQRGAVGVVSMSVNVIGRDAVTFFGHLAAGRFAEARPLEAIVDRLYEAFYIGGSGAYVVIKECMNLVGRPGGWPRRPHLPMDDGERRRLAGILEEIGVLRGGSAARDRRAAE